MLKIVPHMCPDVLQLRRRRSGEIERGHCIHVVKDFLISVKQTLIPQTQVLLLKALTCSPEFGRDHGFRGTAVQGDLLDRLVPDLSSEEQSTVFRRQPAQRPLYVLQHIHSLDQLPERGGIIGQERPLVLVRGWQRCRCCTLPVGIDQQIFCDAHKPSLRIFKRDSCCLSEQQAQKHLVAEVPGTLAIGLVLRKETHNIAVIERIERFNSVCKGFHMTPHLLHHRSSLYLQNHGSTRPSSTRNKGKGVIKKKEMCWLPCYRPLFTLPARH